ncbi:MAG: trypsin-like serine protease [Flavobacteriaceae bacterium]|nr:trypsin-like serine protease [Flavobacteriaceae bacterium]
MRTLLLFFAFCISVILNAQEKPDPEPLQYPFDEIGTESTRGVFGEDDRKEVSDAEGIADFVRATAVMIPKKNLKDNRVYGETLRELLTYQFGTNKFDPNVKFLDQPTCAYCTGFLIAPDVLVTAGHCIKTLEEAKDYVWIFDYTNELRHSTFFGYVEVNPKDIYEVKEILGAEYKNTNEGKVDYSVLRLDRQSERKPYRIRTSGKVSSWGNVTTIGSPTGLPLKVVDNSFVVDNTPKKWFKNSIDGFPGNSGGPVFDNLGFIEGIHVRGAAEYNNGRYTSDYKYDESCDCVKTVEFTYTFGTAGSQAHRILEIPHNLLLSSLYENLEFAIRNHLPSRLDAWLIYPWIFDYQYTQDRGRLDLVASEANNLDALTKIRENSKVPLSGDLEINLLGNALGHNNLDMLDYLLAEGLSPNFGKFSLLENSINRGKDAATLLMLDYNANVNFVNNQNENLLHIAARKGNMNLVKILVEKGVSAKARNNNKKRPEDIAKKYKYKSIQKYLKKARRGKL